MSSYEFELRQFVSILSDRAGDSEPDLSGTPVDNPEAAIAFLECCLELVDPCIKDLSESLEGERQLRNTWLDANRKLKNPTERAKAEQDFMALYSELTVNTVLRDARAKLRIMQTSHAEIIGRIKKQRINLAAAAAAAAAAAPAAAPAAPVATSLQLPMPDIPLFEGKFSEFPRFWDLFSNIVDKSPVPDSHKCSLLLSKLRAEAALTVSGYEANAINYPIIKNTLQSKYGDKAKILRKLRSELFALSPCRNNSEVSSFVARAEAIIKQMEAINKSPLLSDELIQFLEDRLTRTYLDKLNEERKKVVADGRTWNLTEFRKSLLEIVEEQDSISTITQTLRNTNVSTGTSRTNRGPQQQGRSLPPNQGRSYFPRRTGNYPQNSNPSSMTFATATREGQGTKRSQSQPIEQNRGPRKLNNDTQDSGCFVCGKDHWTKFCPLSVNERFLKVQSDGKCRKCIRLGHLAKDCSYKDCYKCGGKHSPYLCEKEAPERNSNQDRRRSNPPPNRKPETTPSFNMATINESAKENNTDNSSNSRHATESQGTTAVAVTAANSGQQRTIIMTAMVKAFNPRTFDNEYCTAIIDTASTESYVRAAVADRLKLTELGERQITINRFGEHRPVMRKMLSNVTFGIVANGKDRTITVNALKTEHIMNEISCVILNNEDIEVIRKHHSKFPVRRRKPDILLGADCLAELKLSFLEVLSNGLSLHATTIGPVICGAEQLQTSVVIEQEVITSVTVSTNDEELYEDIRKFFAQETGFFGEDPQKDEEAEVLKRFEETIRFIPTESDDPKEPPGRYSVGLPWRSEAPDLPTNYGVCLGRLKNNLRRLRQNPEALQKFDDIIKEQIAQGVLEVVPRPWIREGKHLYYMPQQVVEKISSTTTRIRIVNDASAGKPSLNDCLYKGLVYAGVDEKSITAILQRIRLMPGLVTMDLAKAFLQIWLHLCERDAARILWPLDPFHSDVPQVLRYARVVFGINCSPFLLGATMEYHLKKSNSPWAPLLMRGAYVDNYLVEVASQEQVSKAIDEIGKLFWSAGFLCRQYSSNFRSPIDELPEELKEEKTTLSLLGVKWNTLTDNLEFQLRGFEGAATKRTLLAYTASFYDPTGLLCPIILKAKQLQAKLWKYNLKWDETIPKSIEKEWRELTRTWEGQEFIIPRRAFSSLKEEEADYELHGFSDASELGLGMAIYVRQTNPPASTLLVAKSLVVPSSLQPKEKKDKDGNLVKQEISIPKLELQACYLLGKLMEQTANNLMKPVSKLQLWTDATTVVQWLIKSPSKDIFANNRLRFLRKYSVRHIISPANPADIASRGCDPAQLKEKETAELWFHGPKWLSQPEESWPGSAFKFEPGDEKISEELPFGYFECTLAVKTDAEELSNPIIDITRFSRLWRAKRATGYVLRFLKKKILTRSQTKDKFLKEIQDTMSDNRHFTVEEMRLAEKTLIRLAQKQFNPDDKVRSNLGLFEDTAGIVRCRGRYEKASELTEETKFPIFIPRQSNLAYLILQQLHVSQHHCGPNTLMFYFRRKYWTPSLRRLIRQALLHDPKRKCLACYVFLARPFRPPPEPPLPSARINASAPFVHTGTDFFGPIRSKMGNEIRKSYGAIFTCFSTRNVHLELISDMTADRYLLSFRRFVSKCGVPQTVLSDNAKQFRFVSRQLAEEWSKVCESPTLQEYALKREISWRFVTEYSPWRASVYERLIGNLKYCLKRTIGKKLLSFEELGTILVEIQDIVNSRPYIVMNAADVDQPLRPVDFLRPLTRDASKIVEDVDESSEDPEYLLPREKEQQKMIALYKKTIKTINYFWSLWRDQYLLMLREKWRDLHREHDNPRVGQIVIVHTGETPRSVWPMGRIVTLYNNRTAIVKLASGVEIKRSCLHLYPLELDEGEAVPHDTSNPILPEASEKGTPEAQASEEERPSRSRRNLRPAFGPPLLSYLERTPEFVNNSNIQIEFSKLFEILKTSYQYHVDSRFPVPVPITEGNQHIGFANWINNQFYVPRHLVIIPANWMHCLPTHFQGYSAAISIAWDLLAVDEEDLIICRVVFEGRRPPPLYPSNMLYKYGKSKKHNHCSAEVILPGFSFKIRALLTKRFRIIIQIYDQGTWVPRAGGVPGLSGFLFMFSVYGKEIIFLHRKAHVNTGESQQLHYNSMPRDGIGRWQPWVWKENGYTSYQPNTGKITLDETLQKMSNGYCELDDIDSPIPHFVHIHQCGKHLGFGCWLKRTFFIPLYLVEIPQDFNERKFAYLLDPEELYDSPFSNIHGRWQIIPQQDLLLFITDEKEKERPWFPAHVITKYEKSKKKRHVSDVVMLPGCNHRLRALLTKRWHVQIQIFSHDRWLSQPGGLKGLGGMPFVFRVNNKIRVFIHRKCHEVTAESQPIKFKCRRPVDGEVWKEN